MDDGRWTMDDGRWAVSEATVCNSMPQSPRIISSVIGHRSSVIGHRSSVIAHRSSVIVSPFNSRADAAEKLVRDRADRRCDLAHADLFAPLLPHNHHVVPRPHLQPRHVDHRHVHADRADDGYALPPYQHEAAAGETAIQAV